MKASEDTVQVPLIGNETLEEFTFRVCGRLAELINTKKMRKLTTLEEYEKLTLDQIIKKHGISMETQCPQNL